MVGSSLAPKLPIMVPFDRMDHQKSYFSLISDILSVRGCWGQPVLLFLKLVDKTQMLWPPEHAIRDMRSKISICVSVRANLLYTFQCETPCIVCVILCIRKSHCIIASLICGVPFLSACFRPSGGHRIKSILTAWQTSKIPWYAVG